MAMPLGEKKSKDWNMEVAPDNDVEVISESEDENAVQEVSEPSKKAGDVTHKDVQVPANKSVSPENGSDDEVVIVPLDPAIVAKQQEILCRLPFIEEVKKTFRSSLSQGQFSRLEALIRLVKRDNVTMSTLLKIESIMNKLETKFGELVRNRQAREASGAASGSRPLAQRRLLQKSEATERATARESSATETPQTNSHKQKDSGSNTGPTKRKEKPNSAARGDTISISSSDSESEDSKESTNRKRNPQGKSTTGSAGSKASTAERKSVPSPASKVAEEPARKSFASSSPSLSSNKPRYDRTPEPKNTANAAKTQGTNLDHKKPETCKSNTSQKPKEKDRPPPEGQGVLAAIRAARELDREQKQARELANKERAKAKSLQFNASANLGFSRRSNTDPATAFTQQSSPLFTRGSSVQCDADSTSEAAVRQSTPNERHQHQQQQQQPTEPSNGTPPPSLCDKDTARSETAARPLLEARKKLAAMLLDKLDPNGAGGVACTLPLASNSMDPRGRNPNYKSQAMSTAVSNVLGSTPVPPPSVPRDTSPVPPAPTMKPGSVWTPIPGPGSIGFANRGSRGAHARPPHNHHGNQRPGFSGGETQSSGPAPRMPNDFHAVDPRSKPREATWDPREARDPRDPREARDPRDPRCQNMPRPNHQHQHQHQQGYSQGNPANWQSSSWNNNETSSFNGGPGPGPGSGSGAGPGFLPGPRPNLVGGSFRGGHEGRGRGGVGGINHRYIPPGGGRGRGGGHFDVARTYREHREAKARAEAAAAAKVAEEQRLADIEKKRQLEAAEKQRQQEESDCADVPVAVTALPELQLDTSYRNVTSNGPAKKIDFRIPKKTPTVAATTTVGQSLANGRGGESASSSTSPTTNKSCNDNDREKDKNTDNDIDHPATDNNSPSVEKESPRNSPKDVERPERAEKKSKSKDPDKNKSRSKDEHKTKKEEAQAAKKAKKKKNKKLEKLQKEKDNNRTEKNEQKEASHKKATSSTSTSTSSSSSSSTVEIIEKLKNSNTEPQIDGGLSHSSSDNVENEPPMICMPCMPPDKAPDDKPTTPAIQPEDAASEIGLKKSKTEAGPERKPDNATATATVAAIDSESDEKVPKLKIVLGPNGHSTFLFNKDASPLLEGFGQKFKVNTNGDQYGNGDGEKLGITVNPQIHKIMRRRSSMAPTASRPLVDKSSIFDGTSLMYEDLTEKKRKDEKQSQIARNLANMLEKTSDNCRVSTQNIITGKRRTRGIPDCSFNETMLSRDRFGLVQITRTAKATPEEKKSRSTPVPQIETDTDADSILRTASPPVKRKRGRPPAKRPRLDIEQISVPTDVGDSDEQSVAPTPPPPTPPPQTPPPPPNMSGGARGGKPRARKRNELEKLTDYISTMYNGEDVIRASGRRACTVQQAQRRSVTPMEYRETTSPSPSPSPSPIRRPSPREIRNVARRGRPFGARSRDSGGINRTSTILQREMRVRKCCVRLRRFPMPQDNAPTPQQPTPQRKEQQRRRAPRTEPNVNPEWNAMSMAAIDCVVCHKKIDKSPAGHYLQCHRENYISRLATGMLDKLRAGRGNRLRLSAGGGNKNKNKYDFNCPFCMKSLYSFTFYNIALHMIEHTGECKLQCSACRQPIRRQGLMKRHRKHCAPEAQIVSDKRTCSLPLTLHVCPLCDYVQTGRERRDSHLVKHHRLSEELIAAMELEKVTLCCRSTDDKDQETEAETAPNMSVPQVISRRSSVMCTKTPKKKIRFKKQQRKPGRPPKQEQESHEEEEEQMEEQEDGMPASQEMQEIQVPPLEEDAAAGSILVVNECLLDFDPEYEMDVKLLHAQLEEDIDEAEAELLLNEPLQEKPVEEKPILDELLPMEVEDAPTQKPSEKEAASCSKDTGETVVPAVPVEEPIRGLSVDPLMGIGSDDSGSEMDVDVETASASTSPRETSPGPKDVGDDDAENKRVPEDWVDLVDSGSQDESRSKSIFRKFNRFYSRLTNGTGGGGGGGASGSGGGGPRRSSSRTTQSNASNSSECDPSELMPEMRPLEPEPEAKAAREIRIKTKTVPLLAPISVPPAAPAAAAPPAPEVEAAAAAEVPAPVDNTPMSAFTRVENVAYRMREAMVPPSAVYCCLYPGCTFLFSNEREGLERHFDIEHPQVSWSGSCFTCITQDQTKAMLTPPRSIGDELRHLSQKHMSAAAANSPEKLAVAKPALPKLRVRRFSGDLLTEAAKQVEQEQPQQQQANVSTIQLDVDGDTLANGMLRDLLKATPRPINQQVDFNAAGLGEFLCSKPATPPASSARETETLATTAVGGNGNGNGGLYNNKENTGLQIVTVCHLDALHNGQPQNGPVEPAALPTVLPEPLATVNNGHFMVTQSISENHINICLEPTAAEKGATGAGAPTTAGPIRLIEIEDGGRNCSHLSQDRFRCMAVGCGYCAHTVMCIREHMNFHRFSFGSTNYLNCAYCTHVATDVDDYVRHGVYVHGLAPRHELQAAPTRPVTEMSVSQKIREALSQRRNAFPAAVATAVPATAEEQPSSSSVQVQENGLETAPDRAHADGSNGGVTISKALADYLEPTGYADERLYECPERICGARLTSESFVNHILYHIRSSSSRRETELVKCRYCRTLETPPMLRQHVLIHHARHRYICSLCLETATSKEMLIFHVKQSHPQVLGLSNHSFKVIKVYLQESNALRAVQGQTVCHVVGVLMPFEHEQLQAMKHKVIRELKLREAGTKNVFRSSEAKLLPSGDTVLTVSLHCAECLFASKEVVDMQRHLAMHKLQAINAFVESQRLLQAQNSSPEKQTNPEIPEPTPVGGDVAAAAVGGQHKVVNPYTLYVPSEGRLVCGALSCGTQLPSTEALCEHMSKRHQYTEVLWCTFCRSRQPNKMSIPKYLKHLLSHKRHIYQCGCCGRSNPERHVIERHIIDRHPNHNVDVVILRQEANANARLKTSARWIKLPKLSKNPNHNQFICNLCQHMDNSMEKIRGHVEAVHAIKHQYICSVEQCPFGSMDAVTAIQHMLSDHPGVEVQPAHIYQRTLSRVRQTIGFYCCQCRLAFSSFQRIVSHLKECHECLGQYKCPHCMYNCQHERGVITHIVEEHPGLTGLAECQFLRVFNDLPDKMAWAEAHPIEDAQQDNQQQEQQQQQQPRQEEEDQDEDPDQEEDEEPEEQEMQQPSLAANSKISEVIDLIDSDDEAQTAISEQDKDLNNSNSGNNFYVFCCAHCGGSARNLMQLKAHQRQSHPNRSFIFRVQPILLCCMCKSFKSNAKELRDHLIVSHRRTRLTKTLGCDVRRPKECGFCDYQYPSWENLSNHMDKAGHQINDLKNVTEAGLEVLLKLNRSESGAEYYQMCSLCKKVLPDQIAMYHHGQQEHANQGFCFTNVHPLVYHCFYCVFTSLEEMVSLRHMITHFEGFQKCHFCQMPQPGGFEQYIQHCYTNHHDQVGRFRQVYAYPVILRYLLQTPYQFQNGLIINKSSLLNTRYKNDTLIRQLYEELMARAERPPIPRIHIGLKNSTPIGIHGMEPVPKKAKIIKRRQTLGPDELTRVRLLDEQSLNPLPATAAALAPSTNPAEALSGRSANISWTTSFTGANPIPPLQQPPSVAATEAAAAAIASNRKTTAGVQEKIIRNLKRRNSVVVFSRP
ncbi:LOW QUALITY PROTEIN: uncharacterized protein LOC111066267 [Drosophila obscura]|uniref:LOW QUALITY PROTEIN: uncharacterized protein LOC111066267 n=1 Tax=Drosophila obscura TaxID=7282 RepID=UPI001BB135A5|nr:LOW QUALITY PROTEIN: uncharacterized protein LOC111066267 [Drosophila obscura]